jgi:hypothetical protein
MAQPQKTLGKILEFGGGNTGRKSGALEIFIAALSLDEAINTAQLIRIMSVFAEAELDAPERRKLLGWIAIIKEMREKAEVLKGMYARGELGAAQTEEDE